MNLEVKEETDRSPAATPKREEAPITRMSSHDAQPQQNLAAWGDQDWRAEGTKKDNDSRSFLAASRAERYIEPRPLTQVVSSIVCASCLASLQSKGRRSLGASM